MAEDVPKFDARLKEGVAYFEQMLKVMPSDVNALEFLTVAYEQLGETEKCERTLAELARVLLKGGDLKGAVELMPRLEAATAPEALAMAVRLRAASAPPPELVPEKPGDEDTAGQPSASDLRPSVAEAIEAEAAFAERLGEPEVAEALRSNPQSLVPNPQAAGLPLISALAMLEREKPDAFEHILARLADETLDVPVPLDAFDPDRQLASKLPPELVRLRGVIPFARLGETALVVTLSPQDAALKRRVAAALGGSVRFYLAEPRLVEAAIKKLFPEGA